DASALSPLAVPRLEQISLPPVRTPDKTPPIKLHTSVVDRAQHTYGQAFRDVVRSLSGQLDSAPDAVAYPTSEEELRALLDWCAEAKVAAIPYGGGSSVVGGVEARFRDEVACAISVDLTQMSGVVEIDNVSRAARIRGGTLGPQLEDELRASGLTLRHFPQSFEFSSLGGWLATRAGGHFATLYTHIDDLVESMRVVTPRGVLETRRLPGSGAGPSPDRLFLGSEGSLGIITEAWMRLQARPAYKSSVSVAFDDFYAAAEALRHVAQAGLYPSNARVLDSMEAMINGVGDGRSSYLLLAFESAHGPREAWLEQALALVEGGQPGAVRHKAPSTEAVSKGAASDQWKKMLLRAPYLRDGLVRLGAITETFETAICWRDFADFHRTVRETTQRSVQEICGRGFVTSRITHAYPDGAAPYFTVIAPAKPGSQLRQWDEIKVAVSEAIIAGGGTITHHHAVGRDHRPSYDKQRPLLWGDVLGAAKAELDPHGVLNPGALVG
ncbi:MAG: FAD-binding oxidoreductase, partial [Myxococcota bacterium]